MKIKKVFIASIALASLVACGDKKVDEKAKEETKLEEKESQNEEENSTEDESSDANIAKLKEGEEWVVDGQWKLVVNSVKVLEGRNEFVDKDPAEVICVDYSYENLGFDNKIQDLYLFPSSVIDEKGEMAETYSAVEDLKYAQETPIGAKTVGAQEAYALNNVSDTVKINFEQYVETEKGELINYKATIEAKVQK